MYLEFFCESLLVTLAWNLNWHHQEASVTLMSVVTQYTEPQLHTHGLPCVVDVCWVLRGGGGRPALEEVVFQQGPVGT